MLLRLLTFFALLVVPFASAQAAVTATFYSHKFVLMDGLRTDFPHAFVTLTGTTDDGTPVNLHLGFSATNIFIDALWQPVAGALDDEALTDKYVAGSLRHFALPITDAQYRAVMDVEHKWRTWPQPSYDIDTHNCVTFVKEIAVASGLAVSDSKKLVRAPREFLEDVAARNPGLTGAAVAAPPAAAVSNLQDRVDQLQHDSQAARDKAAQ